MLNVEEIRGHWSTIQGKLREQWGQLTDDDVQMAEGNLDQVIGRIQHKIGQAPHRGRILGTCRGRGPCDSSGPTGRT